MKANDPTHALRMRAGDALRTLLEQVSAVRLKEIRQQARGSGRQISLLAHIEVFGHGHTLACAVRSSDESRQIKTALDELRSEAPFFTHDAIPILIAPHLSSEVQTLCKESKVGFLDFDGNARLVMDEVFIFKRLLPRRATPPHLAAGNADTTIEHLQR